MSKIKEIKNVEATLQYDLKIKKILNSVKKENYDFVSELIEFVPFTVLLNTLRYRNIEEEEIDHLIKVPKIGIPTIEKTSYVYMVEKSLMK